MADPSGAGPRQLWLDLDPGIDDSLALLLALASPEVDVLGISVVTGNCSAADGARNARAVLELAGRPDIPVHLGCTRPLLKAVLTAPETHGDTGLGNARLPEPVTPIAPTHGVDALIDAARRGSRSGRAGGRVTLVATAPQTNVALAVRKEPALVTELAEVVIMGGAIRLPGNTTPLAEFNFAVDPHAARIVLEAGFRTTLVPLDVTTRPLLTEAHVRRLAATRSPLGQFVVDATDFYMRFHREYQNVRGCHVHDALALALTFAPDLVTTEPAFVTVETQGELTLGQCVADFRSRTPNARVAVSVDADRFLELLVTRLEALAARRR